MDPTISEKPFPVWALLPKKETGVMNFLSKYPTYDGRGITVAIFDSGVDPGAPGMQCTTDGKVKVVERFDCSGCGDVNTSTVAQLKEDGSVVGLTGRRLVIPEGWENPSGTFHIGVKHAFDLYPDRVRDRIIGEWRERNWDAGQKTAIAEANRQLAALDSNESSTEPERQRKEDLEAQLEYLATAEKKYHDAGPVYDCVVFHDGTKWMACIDTSETGNLTSSPLLGEYSVTHEYVPLTQKDMLNVSINVHNDGNILEIVGLCSYHGTHVAAISAAHFPNDMEKNGIAPGAQIVSLSIGDGRLISMETGTAMVRAMIKVAELCRTTRPVHVINMSYGEHAHWSNTGRIGELMSDLVNRYSVVFVSSAGNHGPALSTISCPPDIGQDTLIGVGAYVSAEMMDAEYSMRQRVSPAPYTWSSRGPAFCGAAGVSVCAPGGAIAPVPNCTLRGAELLNGTSMAAPHVAGAVAVLLSGCKDTNERGEVITSPYSVKRALENGATYLHDADPFAQGCGLLNIERSWKLLCQYSAVAERDIRFQVTCHGGINGQQNMRGIYLRSPSVAYVPQHDIIVAVEPHFLDDDSRPVVAATKITFELHLNLVCDGTFVDCPRHLHLTNVSRNFVVRIDNKNLPPGVYNTVILAYDSTCVRKGPIFRVPVTVIMPQETQPPHTDTHTAIHFDSGAIHRHYYIVPERATYALLRVHECTSNHAINSNNQLKKGLFVLHSVQAIPRQRCRALEVHRMFTVVSGMEVTHAIQVRSGLVLELVLAKYWANVGSQVLNWSLSFHGAMPLNSAPTMHVADGIFQMEIANLQGDELAPVVTLKTAVQILKPTDAKIQPLLANRDVIPPGRQIYELILSYSFHLNKATEVSPNSPLFSDFLYESEFESQLWMIFDANKQFLGAGDAYISKYCIKLEKGDYHIRLQLRHDKKDMLDKLTETSMLLNQKLASTVTIDVCGTHAQAITGSKKNVIVAPLIPTITPLYIAPVQSEKLSSKNGFVANYFSGTISFVKDDIGKKVDTYPFKYILTEPLKSKSSSSSSGAMNGASKDSPPKEKERTKTEELTDAIRELKIQWLSKLGDVGQAGLAEKTYQELIAEGGGYKSTLAGPAHSAYLQCLHPMDARRQLPPLLSSSGTGTRDEIATFSTDEARTVLNVCDSALLCSAEGSGVATLEENAAQIDEDITTLLAHYAIKNDTRPEASQIKQAMDRQKNVLLDCLCRKGMMLCRLRLAKESPAANKMKDEIDIIWTQMLKLVDPGDRSVPAVVTYFTAWHAFTYCHYGRLLKQLNRAQEEKPLRDVDEKIIAVLELLNWRHLVTSVGRALPSKYPPAYKLF